MPKLTLISHHLCPYVQRAVIALAEKNVPFERIDIDLSKKPDWFIALSPLGKVPVLKVGDGEAEEAIFESAVILEFLEETQPPALYPNDPLARARQRAWIEFGSAMLNGIGRLYSAPNQTAFDAALAALDSMAERLEEVLASRDKGPFFSGAQFGLVDAVFGPVFRYFDVFEAHADLKLTGGGEALLNWRRALRERESVRLAVSDDYAERLVRFVIGRGAVLGARMEERVAA